MTRLCVQRPARLSQKGQKRPSYSLPFPKDENPFKCIRIKDNAEIQAVGEALGLVYEVESILF
jgi:hypothetical protein